MSADVGDARTLETLETLWTLTTGHWTPSPHQTRHSARLDAAQLTAHTLTLRYNENVICHLNEKFSHGVADNVLIKKINLNCQVFGGILST